MPRDFPVLPKDEASVAKIINMHMAREDSIMLYKRTLWLVAYYYLNGARSFSQYDPSTQSVRPMWTDSEGNAEFQSQELLAEINRLAGRILAFDLRPRVLAQGQSLSAIRSRATAQVVMDSCVGDDHLDVVKEQFAHTFTCLGAAGLCGWLEDHPTVGLVGDLEVVHPTEVFPFPSLGYNLMKLRGRIRQRFVPLSYLEKIYGKAAISRKLERMEWYERAIGQDDTLDAFGYPTGYPNSYGGAGLSVNYGTGTDPDKENKPTHENQGLVKIRELWVTGARNMVQRYIVNSGDVVLDDLDFGDDEVYCPLSWATFLGTGGFYGAGAFDLLFSLCRQNELLLKTLINAVRDMDRYGFLVIPSGDFPDKPLLREVGRGLKVVPWAPDPFTEGFRPFHVQPATLGDFPGKVASFFQQMAKGLSPLGDLAQEKGRVDSAQGLSFLDERMNQAMTRPSFGVRNAFAEAYRGLAVQAARALVASPRAVPVGRLTLDLAGAVIDAAEGTVSFPQNPIPDLSRLSFSVQEINPKSPAARKGEALDLLQKQVTDPASFVLFAVSEGVDIAMWMDEDKAAYETVVRNCLLIYGDGEHPGQAVITPYNAKPDIQLRVLSSFMLRPAVALASVEVQDALALYRDTLLGFSGRVLPDAVPNPDDAAMLLQQVQGAGPAALPAGAPA